MFSFTKLTHIKLNLTILQAWLLSSLALQRTYFRSVCECVLACVCANDPQLDNWKGPEDPLEESTGHAALPWQQLPLADSIRITVATSGLEGYQLGAPLNAPLPLHTHPLFLCDRFLIGQHVCGLCTRAARRYRGWPSVIVSGCVCQCVVFKVMLGVQWYFLACRGQCSL